MALTLAHLSDTHLGFRALSTMENGVNQRELDVLSSFSKCLTAILECDPDIVVHSGDFFHVVRPGNLAIVQAFRRLSKFQAERKNKPFIIVAGNHDTPRSIDSGNILHLFNAIEGVKVFAGSRAEMIELAELDLELLCVSSASVAQKENVAWAPQTTRKNSILVVHGMEAEVAAGLKSEGDFEFKDTSPERWSYVALGDVHTHHRFARNASYSGATDFTSSNIWLEAGKPKGWVYFDTSKEEFEFVPVETRALHDLKWIDAEGKTAEELESVLIRNAVWPMGQMPIVRQVVQNVARETYNKLGIEWRQQLNARCLSYQLEARRPIEAFTSRGGDATPGMTLEMEWTRHLETAGIPPGIDRKKVTDTGTALLKEVEVLEADPA